MNKLTICYDKGDWKGLYLDGKLIDQGHSINWQYVMHILGYDIETKDTDLESNNETNYPNNLKDLKL